MRTWLYHKAKPARIFDTEKGDDLEKLHAEGWRDNPNVANEIEEDDSSDKNPPAPPSKPAPKAEPVKK